MLQQLQSAMIARVAIATNRRTGQTIPASHCRHAAGGCEQRLGQFAHYLVDAGRSHGLDPWLMAAMAFNTESRIPDLRIPTLVISGDSDQIVPPQNSRNLAARIPDAQLSLIKGGSHLFFLEQPREFNAVLETFLLAH